MGLFDKLKEKALENKQRIVLPESTEPRTLTAANQLIADGIAEIILIGNPEEILKVAEEICFEHITNATIHNPADADVLEE